MSVLSPTIFSAHSGSRVESVVRCRATSARRATSYAPLSGQDGRSTCPTVVRCKRNRLLAQRAPVSLNAVDGGGGKQDQDTAAGGEAFEEEKFAFEPRSKSKRKRRTGENTRRAKVEVVGTAVDAAKGTGERTLVQASEEAYIILLLAYVVVIFLGGILLSLSAFQILPSGLNNWVEDSLYPGFSPLVVGFLVLSSIYGLIKSRDDPNSA